MMQLINTKEELTSFPSSQSIYIYSKDAVEESVLKNNIVLFRLQSESNIKLSEPYSFSLGYLKETFDRSELNFKVEPYEDGYKITCTPQKPLNLDSKYCIYLSNTIKNKAITVDKVVSKSSSTIQANLTDMDNGDKSYTLTIKKTSIFKDGKNLISFTVDDKDYTLDIRTKAVIKLQYADIVFKDVPYIEGESFSIKVYKSSTTGEDYQYQIHTVSSSTIKPIDTKLSSTNISNKSILDFYSTLKENKPAIPLNTIPKYIDSNIFSIKIPDGYKLDISDTNLKSQLSVAFNNYLLKNMKLFKDDHKYKVVLFLDDFNNELIFELLYSENQVEKLVIDTSGVR